MNLERMIYIKSVNLILGRKELFHGKILITPMLLFDFD